MKPKTSARAVGIIPARYDSTRFPGKLLASLGSYTVLERVYRQAQGAGKLDELWVATDDDRIRETVRSFGGRVLVTSSRPRTGSEIPLPEIDGCQLGGRVLNRDRTAPPGQGLERPESAWLGNHEQPLSPAVAGQRQ